MDSEEKAERDIPQARHIEVIKHLIINQKTDEIDSKYLHGSTKIGGGTIIEYAISVANYHDARDGMGKYNIIKVLHDLVSRGKFLDATEGIYEAYRSKPLTEERLLELDKDIKPSKDIIYFYISKLLISGNPLLSSMGNIELLSNLLKTLSFTILPCDWKGCDNYADHHKNLVKSFVLLLKDQFPEGVSQEVYNQLSQDSYYRHPFWPCSKYNLEVAKGAPKIVAVSPEMPAMETGDAKDKAVALGGAEKYKVAPCDEGL